MKRDFRIILTVSVTTVLVLLIIVGFVVYDTAYAQSSNLQTSGFATYENIDYAIKIQYPKNWEKSEQNLPVNAIVQFVAPETKDVRLPAGMIITNFQMSIESSLADFVDFLFKERYQKPTDYKLVSSSNTSLAGMEARQFIMYDYEKNILGIGSTRKVMRVLALDNDTGNGYSIKYWAEPSMFNKYLPTAQRMIESFVTNYKPLPTQKSGNITTVTEKINPNEMINLSSLNTESELTSETNQNIIDVSSLPQFLTVIAERKDSDFPLGAVIGPNSSVQVEKITDIPFSTIELREWNPKFTFQFIEGSNAGLQIAKSVLIGQIKSYNSIQDALTDAKLWRNVPLNEQTVLRLDHKGLNFIIVEVDFTNSLYGLYPGVFDTQPPVNKKYYNDRLRDDLRVDKSLHVASTSEHSTKNDLYWEAVTPLICNDLSSFGFKVCR